MIRHLSFHVSTRNTTIALLAGVSLMAAGASAQSLGDVARKEQSRRQAVAKGKVYTNESLPAIAIPPPVLTSAPAAAPAGQAVVQREPDAQPSPAAPAAPASAESAAPKDEADWRGRLQAIREALARAESCAEARLSRINALSTDFVNRDDPAQRNMIAADRQKALSELERVQKEIVDHKKAVADLQQEARRAGVPAAWVR